jgi:hypothetical protein
MVAKSGNANSWGVDKPMTPQEKYRSTHKEACYQRTKEWRKNNRESINVYKTEYMKTHPEQQEWYKKYIREWERKHRNDAREEIISILGRKCNNPDCIVPPEKLDIRALQIDHVNNDGFKDRCHSSGSRYYSRILKAIKGGSKDYQMLCVYCNWMKKVEYYEVNKL